MAASDVLVSTQWVADHANDANVRLVEVDVDTNAYGEGHIAGARGWNWTSQLQDQVRRDVISKQSLEGLLSESGVGNDDTIILYGDNNNWFAAYAFWVLEMYGHRSLKLMDGGRKKWLDENRPTTKDAPSVSTTSYKAGEPNAKLRARRQEVIDAIGKSGKALVDVRSPAEFSGEILAPPGLQETAQRGGHIPGAANVPWAQAVKEDGTFKSADDLKALYAPKGVTPDKEVIAYCRIGERSSHTWFALKHLLGYDDVRNYDGSWTEYGSMIDVPVEKP
ncbi:MAG TPA: sulfurtransferase [Dehalococcoidia bacterium]|jgi:thiosulfate/3-mercaptopyruvate sulfurtransferase